MGAAPGWEYLVYDFNLSYVMCSNYLHVELIVSDLLLLWVKFFSNLSTFPSQVVMLLNLSFFEKILT